MVGIPVMAGKRGAADAYWQRLAVTGSTGIMAQTPQGKLKAGANAALDLIGPFGTEYLAGGNCLLRSRLAFPEHDNGKALIMRTGNDSRSWLVGRSALIHPATISRGRIVGSRHLTHGHVVLRLAAVDDVAVISGLDGFDSRELLGDAKSARSAAYWGGPGLDNHRVGRSADGLAAGAPS